MLDTSTPASKNAAETLMLEYAKNLSLVPSAMGYIASRGLDMEDVEACKIGYCPPMSSPRSALLKGRIVTPIRNASGDIVAFAGRQFDEAKELALASIWKAFAHKPKIALEQQQTWTRAKWWNESYPKKHHLYNLHDAKHWAREEGYLIIVEGYFDALVLSKMGIKNVVALCGASLSHFHAAKIKRYCDHVICLLDGDEAGINGTQRMLPLLQEAQIQPHIFLLPDGYDPDELVIQFGTRKIKKILNRIIEENLDEMKVNL